MLHDDMPHDLTLVVRKLRKWPISKSVTCANMHIIERLTVNSDTPKTISKFSLDIYLKFVPV